MNGSITVEEFVRGRMPGKLTSVALVLARLKEYAMARGMDAKRFSELELAMAEGLNNAVEHGCSGMPNAEVVFSWSWQGQDFHIAITDPGTYQPSETAAALPEDPLAEGGRGGFLMARLTDRITHRQTKDGHLLEMSKTVGLPLWQAGEAAEMSATLESLAEDLSRSYEELSSLFRFAEDLATSPALAEFLEHSLTRLRNLVGADAAYVRFLSADQALLELQPPVPEILAGLRQSVSMAQPGVEADSVSKRSEITVESETALTANDPLSYFGPAFVCPVFFQAAVLGCLVVVRSKGKAYFSAGELGLIRFVAEFLGIVRTTHNLQEQRQHQQRMLHELEIASTIQASLLPRALPSNAVFRLAGVCQSARQVGGDFYDAISVGTDGILLVIADVMGKGVPAALLATTLRTAIHARMDLAMQPGRLLTEVNRQIARDLSRLDMFITAQLAYLSQTERKFWLASAGHCPLLHCRKQPAVVDQVEGHGIPLGVLDDFEYEALPHPIEEGDLLVFLTDGLYEVEDDDGVMLGLDNLAKEAGLLAGQDRAGFCSRILGFVLSYTGGRMASDDRTLLTVECLKNP